MILSTLSISDEIYLDEERDANITTTPGIVIIMWSLSTAKTEVYRIRVIFGGSLVWRLLSYIQLADIIIGGP